MRKRVKQTSGAAPALKIVAENRFPELRFYGDDFVFNTVSGMFYRLTPSAGLLMRLVAEGAETEELENELQAEYGVNPNTARRDVQLFLNDMRALGLCVHPAARPLSKARA